MGTNVESLWNPSDSPGLYLEMRYGSGLSNEDGSTQSVTFVRKLTCDMHS